MQTSLEVIYGKKSSLGQKCVFYLQESEDPTEPKLSF